MTLDSWPVHTLQHNTQIVSDLDQGGRSERKTHEERRRNYDITRLLPLRAVTSRMTNSNYYNKYYISSPDTVLS